MKNWNKTGTIKSILILVFSLLSLFLLEFNENRELKNEFYIGISFFLFLFIIIFLPLVTKFWSLFGVNFKKPNWNENPLSLDFSKGLILHQFIAYLFITKGIITVLCVGILYQQFDGENTLIFIVGISVVIGIKLSLKWLKKGENKNCSQQRL